MPRESTADLRLEAYSRRYAVLVEILYGSVYIRAQRPRTSTNAAIPNALIVEDGRGSYRCRDEPGEDAATLRELTVASSAIGACIARTSLQE